MCLGEIDVDVYVAVTITTGEDGLEVIHECTDARHISKSLSRSRDHIAAPVHAGK